MSMTVGVKGNTAHPMPERAGRATAFFRVLIVLCVVGFACFLNIIEDVLTGDSTAVDRLLLLRSHELAVSADGTWLTPAARILSLFGNWQVIVPLGLAVLFCAWRRWISGRVALFYALACAGSGGLILLAKHTVARPRPQIVPPLEEAPFASFPSGHTVYALAVYGFLTYLILRTSRPRMPLWLKGVLTVGVAVLLLLVGASRIYLGTHYPSDVAGGYLLGAAWLMALIALYERPHLRQ